MTQIRLRSADDMPGTHVLIIGVGYYRHLRGGPEQRNKVHLGLNVLSSPPISAMRLARWLIDGDGAGSGLHNPRAPLTTLEVLVSSEQSEQLNAAGVAYSIERASLPLVQAGFDRWIDEVQRHANNVGMIYFCGHGVMGNGPEHILLLDDHGANGNRPFQTGSFDLSNTVRALWRQVPAQLYVFVDACRTYSRGIGERLGARPAPLLDDGLSSANVNRGTTWIESTTEGELAYGDSVGISRFTDALLQALDGYCGVPQPGTANWHVNGSALTQAMPKLLAMVNKERGGDPQSCTPHPSGAVDAPLHITAMVPKVRVEIELSPEALRMKSRYEIHNLADTSAPPITGGQADGIWCTEANKGMYEVRIDCASHQPYASGVQYLEPPHYHLPVEVQP
ncbi:caspase family protein [Janthinobacterium sp.]|uniref:caspase family protein n=1 Tax=Janthinobacterium sp. TaxID=1871054 RepID=UPI0025BA7C4D|nr:caspase family protein [Janthinobacterium sp.]